MRVLFVTAEAYPLAKTGGLADVSGALPLALSRRGLDVRLLMPGYPQACSLIEAPRSVGRFAPMLGISDASLISGKLPDTDLPVWLIDSPTLYRRDGGPYQDSLGQAWSDNALRFAFLAHAAERLAMGQTAVGWAPDIVHANDWHTGLLPLLLAQSATPRPRTVFTVHNMAFQGNFAAETASTLGIPEHCCNTDGLEFFGQISFLKAGLRYSDRVTTVSPTYASEILTPEFGCGMDSVLRARGRDFSGILNGIDDQLWNPHTDPHLVQNYGPEAFSGKRACKIALQRELHLPQNLRTPLIGYVSRLTHQKMADIILNVLPWLGEHNVQFAVVGEGDPAIEEALCRAQNLYPGRLVVRIGYDEPLAHRLQAGSDILLAPARFEPCGLTQLYAMRYGTLPVVRRTGGLADTVVNADARSIADRSATGFVFDKANASDLILALARALVLYREPLIWRGMQLQAMAREHNWDASAARYVALYGELKELSGAVAREAAEPAQAVARGEFAGEHESFVSEKRA